MCNPTYSDATRGHGDSSDAIDVSIVIVNWNTRDMLRDCLQSLRDDAGDVTREVIVVDNHSSDDSVAMVANEFPEVQLIRNQENRGFAAANNQGIAISRGRYVLLLNSDTRVLGGAITRTLAFADAHPQAGLVGCRTLFADGVVQPNCFLYPSLLNLVLSLSHLGLIFERHRFFGRRRMTWWNYDSVREVEVIAGCFMLARRQAVDQVGPMAEDYFMYSEDTDWCWRFHRAGWKVMYTPDATIIHKGRASSSQCATDMHLLERRAMLMFLEHKSGRVTRWTANAMFLIGALSRLPRLLLQRLIRPAQADDLAAQWQQAKVTVAFHLLGRLPADLRQRVQDASRTAVQPATMPGR